MTLRIQIVAILICLGVLAYIAYLVKRGRLQLRYSFLWFALALLALIFSIFPEPLFALTYALGFNTPSNAIFFIALIFLAVQTLVLCSVVGKQSEDIKKLAQKVALLEHEAKRNK